MSLTIRKVNKVLEDTGIKILTHGPAGAGKTVLAATTGEPTLILSAESGLLSIAGAPDYIHVVTINNIRDLEDAYEYIKSEEDNPQYSWICLDSITEIAEQILANEKEKSPDPRKAYGNLVDEIIKIMKKFRGLRNYNVYMSCKQQRIKEEGAPSFFAPMLPGNKAWQEISYLFDEVFALRVETDENGNLYRVLQTGRDRNYDAKDRSDALDLFEEPNLKKIKNKIKAYIEVRERMRKNAKKKKAETVEGEAEKKPEEQQEEQGQIDGLRYFVNHEEKALIKIEEGEIVPEDYLEIVFEEFNHLIENEGYSFN